MYDLEASAATLFSGITFVFAKVLATYERNRDKLLLLLLLTLPYW